MNTLCRIVVVLGLLSACSGRIEEVVLHRSNCEVCHQPLNKAGKAEGIEDIHPWVALECTDCHGGHPWICDGTIVETSGGKQCDTGWVYDQTRAHVGPGSGEAYIRNLSSAQLDNIDQEYLRFVNPGDFRVANYTCGGGSAKAGEFGGCHSTIVDNVPRSTMAHTSGEITVARYRAGITEYPAGEFGAVDLLDPNPDPDITCAVEELTQYNPPPIDQSSTDVSTAPTVANAQEQYMVKSCFRCHLNDFGENKFPGDFRSSGCSACHMVYADDGLSRSLDPWVNKQTVPHPITHELKTAPPVDQCVHCHYRGGRIGISFQGYRESAGAGLNPPNVDVLGLGLHGHDANYYITDEDTTNEWDETPMDVHFEAGMHCVDCHTTVDVHGDGHLHSDTQCAVQSECTDCHGTVREYAQPDPTRNNLETIDGKLMLRTKVTNKLLEVTQTKDVVTVGNPKFSAAGKLAMGVNEQGFSHTDTMECYTCHAGWMPSCYGCHVEIDLTKEKNYQTTGALAPGKPTGSRRWIQLNDLVLMRNTDGLMAPSMPAERFFMTLVGVDEEATQERGETVSKTLFATKPRSFTFDDGRTVAGFGQRTFNPHTTRARSQFMACDRCHSVGDPSQPDNQVLLDITFGFGSQRFPQQACDVTNADDSFVPVTDTTVYQLDAIQTHEGKPLVVVGHPDPIESRPLTLDEIEKMRNVLVPVGAPYKTVIAPDALTNPNWPKNQPTGVKTTR